MKNTSSLRFNYEFARVYRHGRYIPGRYMVLHFMRNRLPDNRLGITTGKKVKGSVTRNRIRRLMRESYRLQEINVKKGYDIVLLGRETPNEIKQAQMEKEFVHLMRKAQLWNEPILSGEDADTRATDD
jgi:ribonuclease P protein component